MSVQRTFMAGLFRALATGSMDLPGNSSPVVLGGELRGRLSKVFTVGLEQRDCEGHDSVVAVVHLEGQANEALPLIVDEAADLDSVGARRCNNDFSQDAAFRAGVDNRTIAEGGAGQNPVLNICDRVPGGLAR